MSLVIEGRREGASHDRRDSGNIVAGSLGGGGGGGGLVTDMATRVPLDSVAALLCPPEFYGTVETTILQKYCTSVQS